MAVEQVENFIHSQSNMDVNTLKLKLSQHLDCPVFPLFYLTAFQIHCAGEQSKHNKNVSLF